MQENSNEIITTTCQSRREHTLNYPLVLIVSHIEAVPTSYLTYYTNVCWRRCTESQDVSFSVMDEHADPCSFRKLLRKQH